MSNKGLESFAGDIFDTSTDSMFIMAVEPDDGFRCVAVNEAYLKNTKLVPEKVIGKTLREILPDDAFLTAFKGYSEAIKTHQKVKYIEKVDFGFGEDIVETTISPVFDANGSCTHLVGAAKDLKLQEETNRVLATTQERYHLLAENVSDSIVLYDNNYNILYISPSTEKISGYSVSELIHQPFMSKAHPDDIQNIKTQIEQANKNKLSHQVYQYRYKRKDGEYIWIETTSTRIYDNDGKLHRIVTVNRDIDFRKKAELLLQEQNRKLELLSRSAGEMLSLPDNRAVYHYITKTIGDYVPESIVAVVSVDNNFKTTTIESISSKQPEIIKKIEAIAGFTLPGKTLPLLHGNEGLFKTGRFMQHPRGFAGLLGSVFTLKTKKTLLASSGIRNSYLIGINHNDNLLAATVVFSFDQAGISDGGFIESFVKQAGIVIQRNVLEDRFRFQAMILDQIQDRVTVTDLKGNITYVNKAVEQMLGTKAEALVGRSVKTYGDDPTKGTTQQEIIDGTLQHGSWNGIVVNREPCGTEHFLNVRTRILKNLNGEAIGMCGISTDITEQKKHEELLRESEMRYSNLFNNMVDGFSLNEIITDEHGNPVDWRFLHVNQAHESQTGLKMEHTVGKTIREIFPDIEQHWIDFYGHVAQTGESAKKVSFNHNTGNYYEVNAFCPSHGRFAVVVNNITDRINAENQLQEAKEKAEENENKIRSMFENTLTGIMFVTPEGKILEANPAILHIVGSPSLEVSKQLNVLNHQPLQQIGFTANMIRCLHEKTVISAETQYTSKYGKTTYLKYYLIPIFIKEKPLGVWVNIHDLTDLWLAQTELLAAKEKAEAANRLKTAFLNNISHEVRTPLNGILGFGEILANHEYEEEKKQYYYEILNSNSNRLMQTITDYMDISLITSGNQEVRLSEIKPSVLLKACYDEYLMKCRKKGVELHLILPENSENETINSDSVMLKKSLHHLIENAWKFTDKGNITIGYQPAGKHIGFFVSDTGKGISPENHDRIFGNFVQEDISNTRGYEGSGLGLSIVKGFAGLLGGNITLKSKKNSGSTFRLTIPKNQIPDAVGVKNTETFIQPKSSEGFVILIVEDDESVFDYFDAIFKRFNCTLLKAYNGEEAIGQCRQHPETSLVLMDLKMPVMNGFEATKIIKQLRPTLPIIAQTAYAMAGDEHRALQAGCDDYITKPIKKSILFEKLKKFGFDEDKLTKK